MIRRSMILRSFGMSVICLASVMTGPTAAQTAADLRNAVLPPRPAPAAEPARPVLVTDVGAPTDLPKTSVDHRFASSGLIGSLGYLCGLDNFSHDAMQPRGPATSYGRESTFLGAKLSYAFR